VVERRLSVVERRLSVVELVETPGRSVVEPVETTGRSVVERWLPVVELVETTPGGVETGPRSLSKIVPPTPVEDPVFGV
jgi:hypothetical protein